MTAAGPLVFPGSRALAGWWQQLAPGNPQAIWVAHLFLHRVEALAWCSRPRPVDRFTRLVLQALVLGAGSTLAAVGERLPLGPQLLHRLLHQLERDGLVQRTADGQWQPTVLGRHALEHGEYPAVCHERRSFVFRDGAAAGPGPPFLPLRDNSAAPWPAPEGWSFDVRALQACVRQSVEWKKRRGFPLDVDGIHELSPARSDAAGAGGVSPPSSITNGEPTAGLHPPTPCPHPPLWQRVVVDRAEHLLAVLVRTADNQLLGYAVRQEGGRLDADRPAFALDADWPEVFPELTADVPPEVWRSLWQNWCQVRGLPAGDAKASTLERVGPRLRVGIPRHLLERLRATRSEALRGEAWLLAGEGLVRAAAQLQLAEAG
jgi:hypothetical protein